MRTRPDSTVPLAPEPLRTVLLVDDDEVDREWVVRLLGDGFTVLEARDAQEARRYVEGIRPDCALVDNRLPDDDGLRLIAELSGQGVATVMLTGLGSQDLAVEAMKCGALDYLTKNRIDRDALVRAINHSIERGQLRKKVDEQQESLQAHEQLLIQVLASLPVGVCVLGANGEVRYLNAGARRALGTDGGEGQSIHDILEPDRLFEPGSDRLYRQEDLPLLQALRGQDNQVDEFEIDGDRDRVLLKMTASPIRGADGRVLNAVATIEDITQQHRLENQMRVAQRMESVGLLAGGVAHDFNNLLTIIYGSTDLAMKALPSNSEARRDLVHVVETTRRAERLTRQLLAFSRKQTVRPEVLDVNEVITELEHIVRRVAGETIDVSVELEHNPWACRMDPGALEQVIVNLAVNARDAMPAGGVLRLRTDGIRVDDDYAKTRRVEIPAGEYTRIVVSDTGCGIRPEDVERIFEPFFTTKGAGKGTGLGLSTCYGLIKQAGGFIWVSSEQNVGTTFEVLLPRVQAAVRVKVRRDKLVEMRGAETILVAEDDKRIRTLTERVLRRFGYNVLTAANGCEALDVSEQYGEGIDLLLTDVIMPKMNGRELADRFQQLRPSTRILFMTGYAPTTMLRYGLTEHQPDLLHKPFTPDDLGTKIRAILDGAA